MSRPKEFDPETAMQEAMEAFWERGYNATSVNELLAEMHLNRGSLYGTFGDKKQLFLAVLDKYHQQRLDSVLEVLNRPGSPKGAIHAVIEMLVQECVGESGRRGCLAAKAAMELAPHDKDVAAWLKQVHKRNEKLLADVLKRAEDAGEISRRLEPHAAARFLHCALAGLKLLGVSGPSEKEVREVAAIILKTLE